MPDSPLLLWSGAAAAMAAVLLLRLAWSRPRRSVPLNAAGWGLLLLGLLAGAREEGAWGLSVISLVAMGCAFALLAHAALTAPANRAKPSARRAHALPDRGEALRLGRRFGTFALAVPAALCSALLVTLAARSLAGLADWHQADANVLAFFLMPVIWSILLFMLLMKTDRREQVMLLVLPAVTGGLLLLVERMT